MTTKTQPPTVNRIAEQEKNGKTDPDKARPPTPQERAAACYAAILEACQTHGCRIVPTVESQPVGMGPPSQLLIATSWGVLPN